MKARVLFLCTGNSARSQMAEGWLRHLAGDRFEVFSAGTHPVGLNSGSVEAMAEVGIDIAGHRSKHVSEFLTQPFDYVITVCDRAKESCPTWPGPPICCIGVLTIRRQLPTLTKPIDSCFDEFATRFLDRSRVSWLRRQSHLSQVLAR